MEGQQMPPPTAPQVPLSDAQDIEQNKIWAILAYLGILCLIPLLMKKDSKFAQFHAKQGLVLFIISLPVGFVPIIGGLAGYLLLLAISIVSLVGIIKVLQGKYWKIPVIGEYAEKINI